MKKKQKDQKTEKFKTIFKRLKTEKQKPKSDSEQEEYNMYRENFKLILKPDKFPTPYESENEIGQADQGYQENVCSEVEAG